MLAWYAATFALIVFGAIPVVSIGIISNVEAPCKKESWLAWLCKIPSMVLGLVEGVLPTVLLAVLVKLLPIVLRALARLESIPKRTVLELMTRYFMFLVVHSFLVMSLSGIIMTLPQIVEDPSSIPTILPKNLSQASTFFHTYIFLYRASPAFSWPSRSSCTTSTSTSLAPSIYGLKYGALCRVGDALPRDDPPPRHWSGVQHHRAGDQRPRVRVLRVLLPPLQTPLPLGPRAARALRHRPALLPQGEQPRLRQALCAAVLLAALFFLAVKRTPTPIPEGALMIALTIVTAIFQSMINNTYGPLSHWLPLLVDRIEANPLQIPHEQQADESGKEQGWTRRSRRRKHTMGVSAGRRALVAKCHK
ncbi:hypothetical protein FIBSPDRAFT_1056046 [Athelia psychrophila]|uniref:CSC1/OSCA1-like 7TM region domain-containing protein n=1 Tax=Athelia psychrophila TaxID=1759441 RepID=A0A167SQV1_9AGAM|nr:hypothetical protein FIBSPDRAFT_1056046 [Fibularhizoctonia sp. CBS 109695]